MRCRQRHSFRADLPGRPGFTLIEAVMSILIIGVMYAAVLNTVGASRKTQVTIAAQLKGRDLAEQLLSEIMQQAYWDPVTRGGMGPDAGEDIGKRTLFDDVDDYNNWQDKPPAYKDGTAFTGFDSFKRKVKVNWVNATNPETTVGSESGLKLIEVTVTLNDKDVATLKALRANAD